MLRLEQCAPSCADAGIFVGSAPIWAARARWERRMAILVTYGGGRVWVVCRASPSTSLPTAPLRPRLRRARYTSCTVLSVLKAKM